MFWMVSKETDCREHAWEHVCAQQEKNLDLKGAKSPVGFRPCPILPRCLVPSKCLDGSAQHPQSKGSYRGTLRDSEN